MATDIDITTAATAEALGTGAAAVIDVREPHERDAGYIEGSTHVAMNDLSGAAASLDKSRPLIFYCRVGGRSAMAAQAFRAAGFDARSMAGGILAWDAEGRSLAPDASGTVADH